MKKLKKLSIIALSLAAVLTVGAATASATTVDDSTVLDSPLKFGEIYEGPFGTPRAVTPEDFSVDGMTLIEETETIEDGLRIVDKTYVSNVSNDTIPLNQPTFVTRERSIYDTGSTYGTLLVQMCVGGTFTADGTTAIVESAGKYNALSPAGKDSFVRVKSFIYASDQGSNAFWGNKYAYVEEVITVKINGVEKDFSLYLEVNRNGTIKVST